MELFSHQKEAINFLINNNGKGYIALPPGLGKTRIAVYLLKYYNPKKPLIVAPKSSFAVWLKELEFFGLDPNKHQIINYEKLLSYYKNNGKRPYVDFLILDEAHRVKNIRAQITRVLLAYGKYDFPKILLSGTPYKDLIDLYTQFSIIDPNLFNSWYDFINMFFQKSRNLWGGVEYKPLPNAELKIFNIISPYLFRKSRQDIKDIQKVDVIRKFNTPEEYSWSVYINNAIEEIKEKGKDNYDDILNELTEMIRGQFMHLYRLASENNKEKHEYIIDFIKDNPDTVVYTQFVEEAKKLANATKSYLITGETPILDKLTILQKQDKPIIFTSALSEGADLSSYGNLILSTVPSSTIKYEQVTGRINRLSQQNSLLTYVYCLDEYNEKMYELLRQRQDSINLFYFLAEHALKQLKIKI